MDSDVLRNKALENLFRDFVSHIDMIEAIRRNSADIIYAGKDGIILYEKSSHTCMISMEDLNKCLALIDGKKYHQFAIHQKNIAKCIEGQYEFSHSFKVYQAAYLKSQFQCENFDNIKTLSAHYTKKIYAEYNTLEDQNYIDELIKKRQLWGIFQNSKLAGFIGLHLEGSIGLLKIFKKYRRSGYGYKLEGFLINHFLNLNQVPFCQIVTDNLPSLKLQQKLGMSLSSQLTYWLFN